jgi:multidrug efflux pump subunit AcrB
MSEHHVSDEELVKKTRNTARFFTENRHVAWVLLVATLVWGVFAYARMPKAKDPTIPVRVALAIVPWPGASAAKIEELVTPRLEAKIAENPRLERLDSTTRSSVAIITIVVKEGVDDVAKEFDDIKLKLDGIKDLPEGAGPIQFVKDFGDTATVLLTVASPKVNDVELLLRARDLKAAIAEVREGKPAPAKGERMTMVLSFPPTLDEGPLLRLGQGATRALVAAGAVEDVRVFKGPGFVAFDGVTERTDAELIETAYAWVRENNRLSEIHPDVWRPVVIRHPDDAFERLASVAGDRYSYRELDQFTDTLQRHLQTLPLVSKVTRAGVLPEAVYLEYSQDKLATYSIQPWALGEILAGRNITAPGGVSEIQGRNVAIAPSGALQSEDELGDMLVTTSATGVPVYLRELVDVRRDYQKPRYSNFLTVRGRDGKFERVRAITLAISMRPGSQIDEFAAQLEERLTDVKRLFPEDLVFRRTSDQPLQVKENISLFMSSLYEAILLVVLVGLLGFWEWRSAMVLAVSIPITLAMTFGFMHLVGVDLQQISIASLILALGLLVDDPVVAGDAIKQSLDDGWKPLIAAWLGPTRLATAILFATITNIVAYLPMLGLTGDIGKFIYTLPVVITASLIASRLVSMTFIPLIGYALLRPTVKKPGEGPGAIARWYRSAIAWTIPNRGKALLVAGLLVAGGLFSARSLKVAFFPVDLSYLSYVDVWLPEDAPLIATRDVTREAEAIIQEVAADFGRDFPGKDGKPRDVLASVATFVGGGAPRFWFSVHPEQSQLNYAQMIVQVQDRHDTAKLVPRLQRALSQRIAGAILDVRQLENGKPVGIPVSVRVSGDDPLQLRQQAEKVKAVFRGLPNAERVRDDWGAETFSVKLEVDPDKANLAGISNLDVARSSAVAMSGRTVGQLREGDQQVAIITRMRAEERAQLEDIENLYVTASKSPTRIPLRQISRVEYGLETEKIRRRNQFRTVTVSAFPIAGDLPSQVIKAATPGLDAVRASLPPGYRLEIGGEHEARKAGFGQLAVVCAISVLAIFLALVIQFRSAVKPLVVFATIPFGVAGALASLAVTGAPFGFMAFLGIVSLIGVIVSHVIVKFEFIEEQHAKGVPLQQALVEAGTARLRPVLITVGATVLGLVPLALNGGPLWEPLCYAQMGGLMSATVLTLFLVPVLYTVTVKDLKLMKWDVEQDEVTRIDSHLQVRDQPAPHELMPRRRPDAPRAPEAPVAKPRVVPKSGVLPPPLPKNEATPIVQLPGPEPAAKPDAGETQPLSMDDLEDEGTVKIKTEETKLKPTKKK